MPLRISGPLLLRDELQSRAVPVDDIPMPCFSELAASTVRTAEGLHEFTEGIHKYTNDTVMGLVISLTARMADQLAIVRGCALPGRGDSDLDKESRQRLAEVLIRHGVPLPDTLK